MKTAIDHLLAYSEKHNEYVEWASEYGERGYTTDKGVLLANWNNIPDTLAKLVEASGYELEYNDEWTVIDDKAYRTSADSYDWEPMWILGEGEYYVPETVSDWIEACKTQTHVEIDLIPSRIAQDAIESEGWTMIDPELECGWFPGQNDDPQAIVKALLNKHEYVLVQRSEQSQFYSKYKVYVPNEE